MCQLFHIHKNIPLCLEILSSQNVREDRGTTANMTCSSLSPKVSDFWQLKDLEGMSRSEIVEGAIIRLACRRVLTDREGVKANVRKGALLDRAHVALALQQLPEGRRHYWRAKRSSRGLSSPKFRTKENQGKPCLIFRASKKTNRN